ncbi:MAG: Methyltransferase [Candidatus Tokpelaia sp. JSC189]|nr:MAG: Methyltransferase [Candidatus Tokpelaia sp. JSC189]
MTPLQEKIIHLITLQGPIDISQYMLMVLTDPEYGYYKTAEPFGRKGDFITAPEISQMFGEMLAVWALSAWQGMGQPSPFLLCEIGPGRGTLMDDILRTIGKLSCECLNAAHVVLVETSKRLAAAQKEKLHVYSKKIEWITVFEEIPGFPLILIANELFDTMPIHQYISNHNTLYERMIAIDKNDNLCFSQSFADSDPTLMPISAKKFPDGTVIEISPARFALAQSISAHIAKKRGTALIIDYGTLEPGFGDTLQAISKHSFCSPLKNPGDCDLTSHVDFAALAHAARNEGCYTAGLTQGDFLIRLGLLERAGRLAANKDETIRQQIATDVERLTASYQMGKLFKVLCIANTEITIPPFP